MSKVSSLRSDAIVIYTERQTEHIYYERNEGSQIIILSCHTFIDKTNITTIRRLYTKSTFKFHGCWHGVKKRQKVLPSNPSSFTVLVSNLKCNKLTSSSTTTATTSSSSSSTNDLNETCKTL